MTDAIHVPDGGADHHTQNKSQRPEDHKRRKGTIPAVTCIRILGMLSREMTGEVVLSIAHTGDTTQESHQAAILFVGR